MKAIDNLNGKLKTVIIVPSNNSQTVADGLTILYSSFQTLSDFEKKACIIQYANSIFEISNVSDGRFGNIEDTGTYTYIYTVNLNRAEYGRVRIARNGTSIYQDQSTNTLSSTLTMYTSL